MYVLNLIIDVKYLLTIALECQAYQLQVLIEGTSIVLLMKFYFVLLNSLQMFDCMHQSSYTIHYRMV